MIKGMEITALAWDEVPPPDCRDGVLTLGNFDGVHRGHAALLAETRRLAAALHGPAVAVTFDPHPLQLLHPERFQPLLTNLEDRARLLGQIGADCVVVLRTTPQLLQLSAREFFDRVVRSAFGARALVEGDNFHFGRGREGNIEVLRKFCEPAGVALSVVPPIAYKGERVSSSRVRDALLQGDVARAAELLNRPYRLRGVVSVGRRRGKTLGFPTANLDQVATLIPGDGVYAVRAYQGEASWSGAANVGPNPTFGEQARKVEVHLIGFDGDLYGQQLAVDFLARLRDTRPFADAAQLIEQLRRDVEQAKRVAERPP
jgi:riboflavin kinase/FMN adenylyltransferase